MHQPKLKQKKTAKNEKAKKPTTREDNADAIEGQVTDTPPLAASLHRSVSPKTSFLFICSRTTLVLLPGTLHHRHNQSNQFGSSVKEKGKEGTTVDFHPYYQIQIKRQPPSLSIMEDPISIINDNVTGGSSGSTNEALLLKKLHEVSDRGVELVRMYASIDPTTAEDTDNSRQQHPQPNPWKDPETMLSKLRQVRDELTKAWNDLEKDHQQRRKKRQHNHQSQNDENDGDGQAESQSEPDEEQLRVLYMDMVTDAFADVLDQMRQQEAAATAAAPDGTDDNNNNNNSTGIDVDLLVDCLQNGMEFLDPSDRNKQFFKDFDDGDDDDGDDQDGEEAATMDEGEEDDRISGDMHDLTCHQLHQQEIGFYVSDPSGGVSNK